MDEIRKLAGWLQQGEWPAVGCPQCGIGTLSVKSLNPVDSAASVRHHDDDNWEPDWQFGLFHGMLRCNRRACNESVVVSGAYKVDVSLDDDGSWRGEWGIFYKLRYSIPALPIMALPANVPSEVQEAITAASRILWTDPNSAGNRLRVAIEELLTKKGMRRYVTRNGRKHRLSTHARIQEFKGRDKLVGDTLEAVKWIGNQASHEELLTIDDVLDGAGLLEHALRLMYDKSSDEAARLVRKINKSRGIPKRRS